MKKVVIIVIAVLVLAAMVTAGIVKSRKQTGTEVFVAKAEGGDVVSVVTASGEIQPKTKVNISSQVYGTIVAIPVKEGQIVQKGELLLKIDPEQYLTEVNSLSASVRMASTEIESEETALVTRATQLRRAEALRKDGVLPEDEYDQTKLAYDSSVIRLKSIREQVMQAKAALAKANDQLSKTSIYAPMDGKIVELNTEVGEQVIVGTTNIPGSVMMVIADMSEVLAEVRVDETEVVKIQPEQPVKITVDAVDGVEYGGHITEIRNSAQKENEVNVFGVKVLLEKPDERLRPGMSAKARVEIERRSGVVRVPIQAVLERTQKQVDADLKASAGASPRGRDGEAVAAEPAAEGAAKAEAKPPESTAGGKKPDEKPLEIVYVLRDGKAQLVQVTTGIADESNVQILSGLKEGDTVITGPYRELRRLKTGTAVVEKKEAEFNESGGASASVEID
jgi:HlyD family secretion protein